MWDRMVEELDGSVIDGGEDMEASPELTATLGELTRARDRLRVRTRR